MEAARNDIFLLHLEDSRCKSLVTSHGSVFIFIIRTGFNLACVIVCMSAVLGMMLLVLDTHTLQAEMYVCHDRNGAMNITNVPNSSDCKLFELKSEGSWADLSKSEGSLVGLSDGADSERYDFEIRRISTLYNVDPSLIKAIIHTESDFDYRAVSRCGAQGLMQLMPGTARDLSVVNSFDPLENIDGGTRYFRSLLDSFNDDLVLSLAAYNAGPGLVTRTGGVPEIPETLDYIDKVLKRYKVYKTTW
jgi:hypothetical protein